jgi:trans-2,3-dihydro-3-hydroxyanthranilate isomerase
MKYLHYDVFTSRPLVGNQLAVFPDGRGLTTEQMQAIAREMNFAETTFILPAERPDTDIRMRIFTPAVEMPLAGHPTVGSTFALAHNGVIPRGQKQFVFGLNVGPTRVDLEWEGDELRFVWMTQARPTFGPHIADRAAVAEAVGLLEADLAPGLPIQEVSCGVPYVLMPLRDRERVDRAVPGASAPVAVLLFALEQVRLKAPAFARSAPARPRRSVGGGGDTANGTPTMTYSRMFAPQLGVVEDPATGSAAGPLGCYLVEHRIAGTAEAAPQGAVQIVNVQGVKMARASRIHIAITGSPGDITVVKVGGAAVLVARGGGRRVPCGLAAHGRKVRLKADTTYGATAV